MNPHDSHCRVCINAVVSRSSLTDPSAFQSGEGAVFLISLKAGGLGLNLTAADYVLHMELWWNPAVEDQASNRAHRLGQLCPVTIYCFTTAGTIEERISEMHVSKRDLADSLLEGTDVSGKLTAEQLLTLIRDSFRWSTGFSLPLGNSESGTTLVFRTMPSSLKAVLQQEIRWSTCFSPQISCLIRQRRPLDGNTRQW